MKISSSEKGTLEDDDVSVKTYMSLLGQVDTVPCLTTQCLRFADLSGTERYLGGRERKVLYA